MNGLAEKYRALAERERRERGFPGLIEDHKYAMTGADSIVNADRANRLPLSAQREPARWSTPNHEHEWIARSWVASVEDAARELHNLIVIHDNGGTASSPKKIKKSLDDEPGDLTDVLVQWVDGEDVAERRRIARTMARTVLSAGYRRRAPEVNL